MKKEIKKVKGISVEMPTTKEKEEVGVFQVVNYKGGVVASFFATKELAQVYATKYGYKVK